MSGCYLTFAARRVLAAYLIAVLAAAVTFVMLHVLRPESFFDPRALPVVLGDYLWSAFAHLDLGNSYQPPFRPVSDLIRERIWADLSLVEQVFNIPGVFRYTTGAINNGDIPLLQGMILVGAVMVVIGNLIADLVLARIDPLVRTQ